MRSIVCLNLPSFSGGFNPWGTPSGRKLYSVSCIFCLHEVKIEVDCLVCLMLILAIYSNFSNKFLTDRFDSSLC